MCFGEKEDLKQPFICVINVKLIASYWKNRLNANRLQNVITQETMQKINLISQAN